MEKILYVLTFKSSIKYFNKGNKINLAIIVYAVSHVYINSGL
jgi:hypothetical protein